MSNYSFYKEYPPMIRRKIHLNYLVDKIIFCWITNGNTSYSRKIPVDIKNWWYFGLISSWLEKQNFKEIKTKTRHDNKISI